MIGILIIGFAFSFRISDAFAAYIPLDIGMTPQHYNGKGTSAIVQKKLTWYDSDSTRYYVTYRDGYYEYHYTGKVFTSYSTYTLPVEYELAKGRTTQTWYDYFSVSGIRNSVSMTGSIKLTK